VLVGVNLRIFIDVSALVSLHSGDSGTAEIDECSLSFLLRETGTVCFPLTAGLDSEKRWKAFLAQWPGAVSASASSLGGWKDGPGYVFRIIIFHAYVSVAA
jgi:hypothetical protein